MAGLPKRTDSNGQLYLYINDLLPYKGQIYKHTIHTDKINIMSIFKDGIIANGVVKKTHRADYARWRHRYTTGILTLFRAGLLGYVANYNLMRLVRIYRL